jgi:sulfite dehydrogenase (cytochrome) subunit B
MNGPDEDRAMKRVTGLPAGLPVGLLAGMLAATAPGAGRADEQAITLKAGPGQDVTTAACAACHSLDYIPMNTVFLSPDQWKAEVAKMRQAYGAPIDDAMAEKIVRYLSETYAAPPKG